MANKLTLGPASLILNDTHQLYHNESGNGRLAHGMIFVGDPHRADWFAKTFLRPGYERWEHRGHVFITGFTKNGYKISIITTAMGVGSTDIIVTESIAAHVLDLPARKPKKNPPKLGLLRLGTCGALQPAQLLGVPIVSIGAIGLDTNGLYNLRRPNKFDELASNVSTALYAAHSKRRRRNDPRISFPAYGVSASTRMLKAIDTSAERLGTKLSHGVTITAPGFYQSQGRSILPGIAPAILDLDEVIADVDQSIANFEMEAAVILNLADNSRPRHHAGCICIPVAHRPTDRFMAEMQTELPKQMEAAGALCVATIEAMYDSGDITPH